MKGVRRIFLIGGLAAAGYAAWSYYSRSKTSTPKERRAEGDPDALAAGGTSGRVGVDIAKLQELELTPYKPIVGYLTAIQVQRGEEESTLLFVRRRDLDALAEMAGEDKEAFVEHLREMGVLLSMN